MNFLKDITIISGGQTGVDRAALDFTLEHHIKIGGWCPRGRKAEDGKIPEKYPLTETSSEDYPARTRKNIEESDGTLIIYDQKFDPGTGLTLNLCKKNNKPWITIQLPGEIQKERFHQWLKNENIKVLNVAGPRESIEKGIYIKTIKLLKFIFY